MRLPGTVVLLALLELAVMAFAQSPERAFYESRLPANPHPKQIARLEIAASPCPDASLGNWYHLTATKVNGSRFHVWFLANANPFSLHRRWDMVIHRYILQEPNQPPTEYIDQRTGKALLPLFGFVEKLLPHGDGAPGQAEPHLRLRSMKLAYDLGAEFIWFWTSDHDHHVPYIEQLRLARRISEHAGNRPPRDLEKLRRAGTTAIVIPYGYSLPTSWQLFTWGTHIYPLDRKNEHGLTYKEVLTPAVREIARCLKEHIPYDVVPAGEAFDPDGYERVIWINDNGTRSVE